MTYRVCFVCSGNICRSPMAEAVLRHKLAATDLADVVEVASAGIGAWHVGENADHRARHVLKAAGYPLQHCARQFTRDWFVRFDLVIALDRTHERDLRALAPSPREAAKVQLLQSFADRDQAPCDLDVADPYYGSLAGFTECLQVIERATTGLIEAIQDSMSENGAHCTDPS